MTTHLKNYLFKIILPENKQHYLEYFKQLVVEATRQTLENIWSENLIKQLGRTTIKPHCIVKSSRVFLEQEGIRLYLPSRVRMGIAERIGRILRSQYKRMRCFYDCLRIIELVGVNVSETKLKQIMNYTHQNNNGVPYYKKVLLQQTIQFIKNWQKFNIDLHMFSYCDLVKPTIKRFVLPFGPDNYRELDYKVENNTIWFKIRLPTTSNSRSIKDWEWVEGTIPIPEKLQEKIKESSNMHPKKPRMLSKKLKGGKEHFFFYFPWEFTQQQNIQGNRNRVLAVDLGLKKIATAVVCEKKKQLVRPIYIKLASKQYRHIERLYLHLEGLSKQIELNPEDKRKREEEARIYRKLARIKHQLVHSTTNALIEIVKHWQCETIALEDLRMIKPKRGRKKWSRQLNEWLYGQLTRILLQKCNLERINVIKVSPWGTSKHCPRCTKPIGQNVLGPNNHTPKKSGRWFYCPECGFTSDRDYVAALNVYRASFIDYRKIKSLKDTSPIPYMEIGNPSPNCSWRRPRDDPSQVVLVTGG